ncbi:MAG: hypothetical protein ABJE95_35840 [Byssovorax sp.]
MILRYFQALFSVFFRWWWAVITGIFTILVPMLTPAAGITLTPIRLGVLLFVLSTLVFLLLSVISASWGWYTKGRTHPVLVELVPEQPGQTPLTFVVASEGDPLPPGSLLAVFRMMDHGVEVCAAVLEVRAERTDGGGLQAEPKWISALHQNALQQNKVKKNNLKLRLVDAGPLALVEKCIQEKI